MIRNAITDSRRLKAWRSPKSRMGGHGGRKRDKGEGAGNMVKEFVSRKVFKEIFVYNVKL
jgi:hypothetical protein